MAQAHRQRVEGLDAELRRALGTPEEAISRLEIIDEDGVAHHFDEPFEEQVLVHDDVQSTDVETAVYCKSRQIGLTTVLAAEGFDYTYRTQDAVRTLIVADSDETNDAIFRRVAHFHDALPDLLKRRLLHSNRAELVYEDTLAGMRVLTAGGRSKGRGWTYQRLLADEVAFWPDARRVWASVTSTLHRGPHHKVMICSTPNGPGNLFHEKVMAALAAMKAGDTRIRFRFFEWFRHAAYRAEPPAGWEPDEAEVELARRFGLDIRQLWWRHQKVHGVDGIGEALFLREYPATVEDGFLVYEGSWFDASYLNAVLSTLTLKPGEIRIYEKPKRGMTYAAGIDGSWCNGGDDAVLQVLSRDGRQVATYSTNQGGELLFSTKAAELIQYYNRARTLCEANAGGGGRVIIRELQKSGLPLWHQPAQHKGERLKNWVTTHETNEDAYAHARQMVNGDALALNDFETVQQLLHIREVDGKVEGQDGYHDDHADALVLAEWNRRTLPAAQDLESSFDGWRRDLRATPNPFNPSTTRH